MSAVTRTTDEAADEASADRRRWRFAWPDVLRLDRDMAIFAFQVSMAASLAMYLAFLIDLQNTYWALLTIPLVVRQQSGMTVWRSAARVGGTLIGAFVALFFVGFFAQSGETMIACLALWIFACGFLARFEIGADAYAYGTAGLTALVIAIDTGPNADLVFGYALARTTETLIAVVAGFMVLLTIFPQSITQTLMSGIADARSKVFGLMRRAADVYDEQPIGERKAVLESLLTIFTNLRAQRFERSHAAPAVSRVAAATNRLNHVLVAGEALSFVLAQYRADGRQSRRVDEARDRLVEKLDALPQEQTTAEEADRHARELRRLAGTLDRGEALREAMGEADEGPRLEALALYRMHAMAVATARFLEADAAVLDTSRPELRQKPVSSRYRDISAAVQKGLRPMVAFLTAAFIWFATGWQNGGVFTLITGALTLLFPTIVPRSILSTAGRKLALGFFSGGVIAIFFSCTMPYMSGFGGFLILFAPTIFTIFYLTAGGGNLPIAIGTTIMIAVSFAPSNDQNYDILRILNIVATLILMPAALITAVNVILPENTTWLRRHLRRGTSKLLARAAARKPVDADAYLAQMIDLVADYGGDLDPADETDARLIERGRAATHAGLELAELRRMAASGRLPDELIGTIEPTVDAVLEAAELTKGRSGEDSPPARALAQVAETVRRRLKSERPTGLCRGATLRFAMAIELLRSLIVQSRLALPDKA